MLLSCHPIPLLFLVFGLIYPLEAALTIVLEDSSSDGWVVPVVVVLVLFFVSLVLFVALVAAVFFFIVMRRRRMIRRFGEIDDIIIAEGTAARGDENPISSLQINTTLFEIDFNDIRLERVSVYQAEWHGQPVAFKVFRMSDLSEQSDFDDFERSISILSSISHPNILAFYGASIHPPRLGIVMEYCENGTLGDYLTEHPTEPLSSRLSILRGIASGLQYLHDRNIIHRKIDHTEILLTGDLVPKICDFTQTGKTSNPSTAHVPISNSDYMAPEVVLGSSYGAEVDTYSFGILCYCVLLANFHPYGNSASNVELRVANDPDFRPDNLPLRDSGASEDVVELVVKCWDADIGTRPSWERVLAVLDLGKEKDEK